MSETVHVRVLGVAITLVFDHADSACATRRLLAPMLEPPWSSPDIVIECPWRTLGRRLIRTDLDDDGESDPVIVYSSEYPDGLLWRSEDPPFPPVVLEPIRQRFVRLHAAAVSDPFGNALLIVGESGSGKTTLSSALAQQFGYRVLTDEDVFVHRRSTVVESFAMGTGPWHDRAVGSLWERRPDLISTEPASIDAILNLDVRASSAATEPVAIPQRAAIRELLSAQRPSGTEPGECVATLANLTRSTSAYAVSGGDYESLQQLTPEIAKLFATCGGRR